MTWTSLKKKISVCMTIMKAPVVMVTNHNKGGIHTIEAIIRNSEDKK